MNTIKNIPVRTKNFVVRHKTGFAVIATAFTCIAINRSAVKEYNAFLEKKGLLDEYYSFED